MILLYQLTPDTLQQAGLATETAAKKISLWDMLVQGGVLMIPLALLLVLAIFFFIERLLAIRKASKIEPNFMNIIRDNIVTGNITFGLASVDTIRKNNNRINNISFRAPVCTSACAFNFLLTFISGIVSSE